MSVNLSIKNAPDEVVEQLRRRARRNHRSLQGELLAIIEAAVQEEQTLRPGELLTQVRALGLRSPSESVEIVRASRDRD
jgi:plasmid stability protein